MSENIEELADSLEEHGSSRAHFRDATLGQRCRIAKILLTARSEAQSDGESNDNSMMRKKNNYFHRCGRAGISPPEARNIWWSVVYDNPAPAERIELV